MSLQLRNRPGLPELMVLSRAPGHAHVCILSAALLSDSDLLRETLDSGEDTEGFGGSLAAIHSGDSLRSPHCCPSYLSICTMDPDMLLRPWRYTEAFPITLALPPWETLL